MAKQKLELTWIGKDKRPKLEPRILLEDPDKSYHAKKRVTENDFFDNRLIFGDNLLALKALEQEFTGRVKFIYIDPPYNTQSAISDFYEDGLEHSVWLGLIRDRLESLRTLLASDGIIAVQIDDREMAYLQVLMDEVFGRACRVNVVAVKMSELSGVKMSHAERKLPKLKEYILIYGKSPECFVRPVKVRKGKEKLEKYLNYYSKVIVNPNDPVEKWKILPIKDYMTLKGMDISDESYCDFQIAESNRVIYRTNNSALAGLAFRTKTASVTSSTGLQYVWWEGKQMLFLSDYLDEYVGDLWVDISTINLNKEGGVAFPNGKKPEMLIRRLIEMCTEPGDLVLDSFAGSGSTGAVAHKMGRRWIMVELGEHCHTHIIPRLRKVIDGEDKGGITDSAGWQGGGGFRYYKLAPSLIIEDRWGNPVINPEYNPAQLAEAIAKLEGFSYAPSDSQWWQHGHSSERDFLYVTTQNLSATQLAAIAEEVGAHSSLLICCSAFHGISANEAANRWPNLTLKKIPKMVLARCEWGEDDYSLNVVNLPMAKPEPAAPVSTRERRGRRAQETGQDGLFGEDQP